MRFHCCATSTSLACCSQGWVEQLCFGLRHHQTPFSLLICCMHASSWTCLLAKGMVDPCRLRRGYGGSRARAKRKGSKSFSRLETLEGVAGGKPQLLARASALQQPKAPYLKVSDMSSAQKDRSSEKCSAVGQDTLTALNRRLWYL